MQTVPNPLLQQYIKLTEFLGLALGPDYEVALHDLANKDHSIIAIANSHISGRKLGAPLTNMALSILRDKSYERMDYHLHYYSINVNGKTSDPAPFSSRTVASSSACCASTLTTAAIGMSVTAS